MKWLGHWALHGLDCVDSPPWYKDWEEDARSGMWGADCAWATPQSTIKFVGLKWRVAHGDSDGAIPESRRPCRYGLRKELPLLPHSRVLKARAARLHSIVKAMQFKAGLHFARPPHLWMTVLKQPMANTRPPER